MKKQTLLVIGVVGGLGGFAATAMKQQVPGTQLSVVLGLDSASYGSGQLHLWYEATNSGNSVEKMAMLLVDSPPGVTSITAPTEPTWGTFSHYRQRPMAVWLAIGTTMNPGNTSPLLTFSAPGLPGIGSAWAAGYVPPMPVPDSVAEVPPPPDLLTERAVALTTVVPEEVQSTDPAALFDRIQQQLNDSCGSLGWITNNGVCNSLQVKLDEVSQAVAANNLAAAAGALMAFSNELDALNVRFVSGEAYWMLKINAEALASQVG